MSIGADYAWSHPTPTALKGAGVTFVMRYLSNDPTKNITRAEADALAAKGIWSGVVWESTANRAGAGKAAGTADAKTALAQATAAGMPEDRPVYLAVDYAATPSTVEPYFEGAASVLGLDRTGVYGGYPVVSHLLDKGLVRWAWQTTAWSAGKWDLRAHIRQGAYVTIGGVQCDRNTATTSDFGQWMPGKTPTPEDDVALTTAQTKALAQIPQIAEDTAELCKYLLSILSLTETDAKGPVAHQAGYYLAHINADAAAVRTAVGSLSPQLSDAQLDTLATKVVTQLGDDIVEKIAQRIANG